MLWTLLAGTEIHAHKGSCILASWVRYESKIFNLSGFDISYVGSIQ